MGSLPEKSKMHLISLSIVDSLFLSVAQNHHHLPLIANKVSSNVQLLSSFFENLQLLSWSVNRQDYYEIKLIIVVSLRLSFLVFKLLQLRLRQRRHQNLELGGSFVIDCVQ